MPTGFGPLPDNYLQPLPIRTGLYYRVHKRDAPFGPEHARTVPNVPMGYKPVIDDPKYDLSIPKEGYSAFWNPHHVEQYVRSMGWTPEEDDVRVIAFEADPVGEGYDGEPRVMPRSDEIVGEVEWPDFLDQLEVTPNGYGMWHEHTWGDGPEGKVADDGYTQIGGIRTEGIRPAADFGPIPDEPPKLKRVAPGIYDSDDGRITMYRLEGVHPPAWNVEWTTDYSYEMQLGDYLADDLHSNIVDGARSMGDAKRFYEEDVARDAREDRAEEAAVRRGIRTEGTGEFATGPAGETMWTGWKNLKPGDRVVSYKDGRVLASGEFVKFPSKPTGGRRTLFDMVKHVGLTVRWDNGVEGKVVNPARMLRREGGPFEPGAIRTEGVEPEIRVESWAGGSMTVTDPADAIAAAAKLWDDAGPHPGRPTINFYVNGKLVRTVNNRAELGPQLRTEGIGPPNPQMMFHAAPRAARGTIEQTGIDYTAGKRPSGEVPDYIQGLGTMPEGNFLWDNLGSAIDYMMFWSGRDFDLYVVDAREIDLRADPIGGPTQIGAWYTTDPIPRDRVRLIPPEELRGVRSEGVTETTLAGRGFKVAREVAWPDEVPPLDNASVEEVDGGKRHTVRLPVGSAGGLADRLDRFARVQATGERRSDARAAADAAAALRRGFRPIRSEGIDNPASAVREDFDEVEPTPGPDVGIHSTGGFGAAESLRDQYESSGTGGFGTGFYFVSTPDRLSDSYIGERGEARGGGWSGST